jgi:hypothetical protein
MNKRQKKERIAKIKSCVIAKKQAEKERRRKYSEELAALKALETAEKESRIAALNTPKTSMGEW